ncbi:SfnB family sulfur acquisition oxidoreductase [Rhizobium sp. LC145]|uniref:SfnB family sulfur acquisition oxidoreductase n=1 Tax=Rhizobium sp. LC145 TaxID=1120688 RepID=UPI000629F7BA|nr:SfnB family sulfur acquisition oxidoreductase [Rhizobium sp. LC145]KKX27145.1 acyl-CoA dehydrogenase [Rhizobium sp. LC145]TKT57673.1 SfnB family sulfur acquisition oxidoreductase [Rhizobiaceae bacterium LC148]
MSRVFHLAGKIRAVAPYLATEDEAIEVASALAARLAEGSSHRDRERILPYDEMELIAQSGLLGTTVPSEYGGADISNAFLAEVIAILAEADGSIGQIPQSHFYILEALRLSGTEEQKKYFFTRALAGEHFANALAEAGTGVAGDIETRFVPDGMGYRITGRKYYSTGALFADWIAIFGKDHQGRLAMGIVSRRTDGLTITDDWDGFGQRTTASGTVLLKNVYVPADSVIGYHSSLERHAPLGSLGQLLHAAVDLGIARAAFTDMVGFVRGKSRGNRNIGIETASEDPLTIARAGSIAVKIEAATAVLERSGRKVDAAQISPSPEAAVEASLAVAAAKILTTEAALEATNGLFELAGTSSTKESLNLDRHWRNARTHTVHDPVRWKHHAIGDFHLNGNVPLPNGQF